VHVIILKSTLFPKNSEPKKKHLIFIFEKKENKINSERYNLKIGVFAEDFFSAVNTINFPSLTPTSK